MKKQFLLSLMLLSAGLSASAAYPTNVADQNGVIYKLTEDVIGENTIHQASVIGHQTSNAEFYDLDIPPFITYDGHQFDVMTIGNAAFKDNAKVQHVTMSNSITSIGVESFYGCTNLESVTFSQNLANIAYASFTGCTKLNNVTIPSSVSQIRANAFAQCSSLSNLTLSEGLQYISEAAFAKCGLTQVTIPSTVIFSSAEIPNVPSGQIVTNNYAYGYHLFWDNPNLTSITFLNSPSVIGTEFFKDCAALEEITFSGSTAPSINSTAFSGVNISGLTINVPAGASNSYTSAFASLGVTSSQIVADETTYADFASAFYKEVPVNSTTGTNNKTGWFERWTSNAAAGVNGIITIQARNTAGAGKNNMAFSSGILQAACGSDSPYFSSFTLTCTDPDYYIAGYSFKADMAQASADGATLTLRTSNGQSYSLVYGTQTEVVVNDLAEGAEVKFEFDGSAVGANKATYLRDFKLILAPKSDNWYVLTNVSTFSTNGYYVANVNNEYRQNATNFYPLKYINVLPASKPAVTFVKITNSATSGKRYVQSADGHYVQGNCIAAIAATDSYVTLRTDNNVPVNDSYYISVNANGGGTRWGYFAAGPESPLVGGGTGAVSSYQLHPAHATVYDRWTVVVENATAAGEIGNNPRVEILSSANKGISKVYNNGTFFVGKGTELTVNDFRGETYNGVVPGITLDHVNHRVIANYGTANADFAVLKTTAQEKANTIKAYQHLFGPVCVAAINIIENLEIEEGDSRDLGFEKLELLNEAYAYIQPMEESQLWGHMVVLESVTYPGKYLYSDGVLESDHQRLILGDKPVEGGKFIYCYKAGTPSSTNNTTLLNPRYFGYLTKAGRLSATGNPRGEMRFDVVDGGVKVILTNDGTEKALAVVSEDASATFGDVANGSVWKLVPAGIDDAPASDGSKYYRLRASATYNGTLSTRQSGTLLSVSKTTLGNRIPAGSSQSLTLKLDGVETLWTLHSDGRGNTYIRNAVTDFAGQDAPFGIKHNSSSPATVAADATALGLIPAAQANEGYTWHNNAAYVLRTPDDTYIYANSGATIGLLSDVADSQNGNSCVFYLEEAYDAQEQIDEYVASAEWINPICKLRSYAAIPAIWSAEKANKAIEDIEAMGCTVPTTVKEAHTPASPEVTAIVNEVYNSADGRKIHLENKLYPGYYLAYNGSSEVPHGVENATRELGAIWILRNDKENGGYKLENYRNGKQCTNLTTHAASDNMNMAEAGYTFDLEPSSLNGNPTLLISDKNTTEEYRYFHMLNDPRKLVKWCVADAVATHWAVSCVDDVASAELDVDVDYTDGKHVVTVSHTSDLALHASYHALHAVTVTKRTAAENAPRRVAATEGGGISVSHTDAQVDGGTATFDLGQKLAQGTYDVTIPMGFFKVGDDLLSKEVNTSFSVADDGTTVGIGEVTVTHTKVDSIYDLQGRRLSEPRKGAVNIVNGKKIFVY